MAIGRSGEEVDPAADRGQSILSLRFTVRGSRDVFEGGAECTGRGANATCQVEGDGGAFSLQGVNATTVRMTVRGRLALEGGESFSPELGGAADRVFVLNRASGAACPGP